MTHRIFPATLGILCTLGALPLVTRVSAEDAGSVARQVIGNILAEESAASAGRIAVTVTERRGAFVPGESEIEMRRRMSGEIPVEADGTFVFGQDGWAKDLNINPSGTIKSPVHTRMVESKGLVRFLVEAPAGTKTNRSGRITQSIATAPGDALLSHKAAHILSGIQWTGLRTEGQQLILDGTHQDERHTLVLSNATPRKLQAWNFTRPVTDSSGKKSEQRYYCEITRSDSGISKVEEWIENPPPAASDAYRLTLVKKLEALPKLQPDDLTVHFPKGTLVSDGRSGDPVEYELEEDGLDDAKVAAAVEVIARARTHAGDPAPAFTLNDLHGKPIKLEAFHGKPVLLYWFSSQSRACSASGKAMEAIYQAYKDRGLAVLGIDELEEGDPAKEAEAFSSRYEWTFSVLLDPDSATLHRYGAVDAVPKVAIVDGTGKIAYVSPGVDVDGITATLDRVAPAK